MVTVQVEGLSYYTLYCENMELRFLHSGSWCVEDFFDVCRKIHSPRRHAPSGRNDSMYYVTYVRQERGGGA